MAQSKELSGAVFKNKRKAQPNHPDITGKCMIGGKEYWISGWRHEHDGEGYYSLAFTAADQAAGKGRGKAPAPAPATQPEPEEDDIPF